MSDKLRPSLFIPQWMPLWVEQLKAALENPEMTLKLFLGNNYPLCYVLIWLHNSPPVSHWANMFFYQWAAMAYIKCLVMRQLCPITVTVIFNMSDKMNPLWKYFILKFVQKNSSYFHFYSSKFFPHSFRKDERKVKVYQIRTDQISLSVVSDSSQPHELQHARLLCPPPPPWVFSNSCQLVGDAT